MIDEKLLENFIKHIKSLKSDNTYQTYEQALAVTFPITIDLSPEYVLDKIEEWKSRNNSANTIKLRLSVLSEFIKYVDMFQEVEHKQYLLNIFSNFKGETKVKPVLSKEDVLRIIGCTKKPRDKVIVSLLATSGIRVSELIALTTDNVVDNQIHIKDTKNNTERLVTLPDPMVNLLEEYISKFNVTGLLFKTRDGKPMSTMVIQQMVKRAAELAGVDNVSPHSFRHFLHHIILKR